MHFNYRSKHKHKKSCFVNARILESFYKKGKKLRKKMKKWQIENSEKSEKIEERFPKYNSQDEEQGIWQMRPSHLSIILNFFLLQTFFMVSLLHFAEISIPAISFNHCSPY